MDHVEKMRLAQQKSLGVPENGLKSVPKDKPKVKKKRKPPKPAEEHDKMEWPLRLPHLSSVVLHYDGKGLWSGTMTIPAEGEPGGEKVFIGSHEGQFQLLHELTAQYRKWKQDKGPTV